MALTWTEAAVIKITIFPPIYCVTQVLMLIFRKMYHILGWINKLRSLILMLSFKIRHFCNMYNVL